MPKIEQETPAAASGYFVSLKRAYALLRTRAWEMVPAAHVWEGVRSLASGCACQHAALASQKNFSQLPNQAWTLASALPDTAPRPVQTTVMSKAILVYKLQLTAVCKHEKSCLYRVLLTHSAGQRAPAECQEHATATAGAGEQRAMLLRHGPAA